MLKVKICLELSYHINIWHLFFPWHYSSPQCELASFRLAEFDKTLTAIIEWWEILIWPEFRFPHPYVENDNMKGKSDICEEWNFVVIKESVRSHFF